MKWKLKIRKINAIKSCFFGMKNKINKLLSKLTKQRKEKTQIDKMK
jgi:hypothetical protein